MSQQRELITDKESHYTMIRGAILQGYIMILNVYAPNNRATKYVNQKLIKVKGKIDKTTIMLETSIWLSVERGNN